MRIKQSLSSMIGVFRNRTLFDQTYYHEAESNRLLNLFAHLDLNSIKDFSILEVGAGLGYIGDIFRKLGFDVTSTDGRPEFVKRMKEMGKKSFVIDLDNTGIDEVGDYDIVLSFGVLYHLSNPELFISSAGKKTKILLLETVVMDSNEIEIEYVEERQGLMSKDQAVNRTGCRPSPAWIEKSCKDAGFIKMTDISTSVANWSTSIFDWDIQNTKKWKRGSKNLRRMWICNR